MSRSALLALSVLLFTGCEKDEVQDTSEVEGEHVMLRFAATLNGAAPDCNTSVALGSGEDSASLADARFFVHAVQAKNAEGEWVDMMLHDDGQWQYSGVALLDFEDGTGSCADSGTADLNDQVQGELPAGEYSGLRFNVGVPFELNHLDSATADAPMNTPGMFWSWQGGYKHLRVDVLVDQEVPVRWNTHLGSTGCVSDAPTQAPTLVCDQPNVATITLDGFVPGTDTVAVDLGALAGDLDLSLNTEATPPGCMSGPTEPEDCAPAFEAMGLSFETGECEADCAGQSLFSVSAG